MRFTRHLGTSHLGTLLYDRGMREIGGFTVGRELHRTGVVRVLLAAADRREAFVAKVCEPDVEVMGERGAAGAVREFVARAEANREIGENRECADGGRWARVYHVGRTPDGAAAVMDLATLGTAERLIAGRVALDSVALAHVIGEVVEGLRDLARGMKRGHGALTAGNVLLGGDEEKGIAGARVMLADAAVDLKPATESRGTQGKEPATECRGTPEDLRGIGELIHGLVLHTPFKGGWPIENSPKWRAFGADGSTWRELVNVLLDPNPKAARPTLDELAATIAPMRVPRKSRRGLWTTLAAALILLGVAGGVVWHYTHREKITIVKWLEAPEQHAAEWRELCEAYRGWYSLFQAGLGKAPTGALRGMGFGTRREAYAATDPQLKELLSLPGVADGFDPWSIARVGRDVELGVLSATPTDYARSDEGIEKTEKARAAVGALKKGLTEEWEAPGKLKEAGARYRGHGWARPASALESAAAQVNPEKAPDPAEAVDLVLGLEAAVVRVDAAWKTMEEAGAELARAGDEVLGRFGAASESMVGAGLGDATKEGTREDLGALEKQAGEVADLAGQLAGFVRAKSGGWAATDTESFTSSPEYGKLRTSPPTAEVFKGWLALVKQHPALDPATDPRRGLDAGARIASIDASAAALTAKPLRGAMDADVAQRLAKAKLDVAAIAPEKVRWKRTTRDRLTAEAGRLDAELTAIKGSVEGLITARRAEIATRAAEEKGALGGKNEVVAGSAAINGAWRAWRDRTLAAFVDADYAETTEAAGRVERAFVDLDARVFPGALARDGAGVPQADWAVALADVSAAERERRLAGVLADVGGKPVDLESAAFATAAGAAGREFGEWVAKVGRMRAEIGAAEGALDAGQDVTGPASIEAVVDRWMADPVGKHAGVSAAISGIRERVAETRAVRKETSTDALVGMIVSPVEGKWERALAAWRRLGDAEIGWPKTKGEFERAKAVRAGLETVIGKLPEMRRGPTRARADGDMRARWVRYAGGVRDAGALDGALAAMGDFGVSEDGLEGALRYNAMVWRLRKEVTPDTGDARVAEMIAEFAQKTRAIGAGVMDAPVVSRLIRDAATIAQGDDLKKIWVDARTLGPGKLGGKWAATMNAEAGELAFTRGQTTLTFVRMQLKDGGEGEAAYISTRELSIGDAAEILDAAGGQSAFKATLPDARAWAGPRGWAIDGRGNLATHGWIQVDANMTASLPGYAPGIQVPGEIAKVQDAAGGEPRRESPLQSMPPESLAMVARYAGCRFLTSAEWKAAHAMFDGGSTPAGANLRDATFAKQRDYVDNARRTPGLARMDAFQWPDVNVFVPADVKSKPVTGRDAKARPENDGVLWFLPTESGGGTRVHHLVGNVAELVVDDWKRFESTPPTGVSDLFAKVSVLAIGGSALSAPELPVDQPLAVDLFDAGEGLADLGCRLAFDATGTPPPRQSYASRFSRLLGGEVYLMGR